MINGNIIRKELFQLRWVIIIGLLLSAGTALMLVLTFHYIGLAAFEIPEELAEAIASFEIGRDLLLVFSDYPLYAWSQWNAKNLLQLGSLLAIILAASQFAGEIGRRTISFLLTRPVSRKEVYVSKAAAGMLVLFIVFGSGTVLIWAASAAAGLSAPWGSFFTASLISLTWLNCYYLVAVALSQLNREPIMAGVYAGFAGVVLSLPGFALSTRPLSLFYQLRASAYYLEEQPFVFGLGAGLLAALILLALGTAIFRSRDF